MAWAAAPVDFTMGGARAGTSDKCPSRPNRGARSAKLDRVCTDAMAYANGTGGPNRSAVGPVDITSAVTPGRTADVRVLVAALAGPNR
jgi:hypothetical protein